MSKNGPATHRFDILLSCDHVVRYPSPAPEFGDVLWCRSCDDYAIARHYASVASEVWSTESEVCQ